MTQTESMIMLSLAIGYAISIKASDVYYGAHSGDHTIYPDCRPEFLTAIEKVALICDWKKVNIKAPYLYLTKTDILRIGLQLKVPYNKTWTCYKGKKFACGVCGSCRERLEAFEQNRTSDPLKYSI